MKEFGDGFYKNNGETNNSEKKEPQKEGVETVKDDGDNKDGENGESNETGNNQPLSLDDFSKIMGSINDPDEDDDFFANESQSEWATWLTEWFPNEAEEIERYHQLIGEINMSKFNRGLDPFQENEDQVNLLKEKYGVDKVNNCFMAQLLVGSTPGCKDTVFYDLDEPDSIRGYIDNELKKLEN